MMQGFKSLTAVSTCLLLTFGVGCQSREVTPEEPDVTSVAFLLEVAGEMNETLPMRVDSETELVHLSAEEATIIYNYRLPNLSAADVSIEEIREKTQPSTTVAACSTPETRDSFLKQGITMRYVYKDSSGLHIGSFDVTPANCLF